MTALDHPELSPADLHPLHAEDAVHLIDVREPHEWAMSRIPGAQHIPLAELGNHLEHLRGLEKPLVFYCHSGSRSMVARELLLRQGITGQSLAGGILTWYHSGGAVVA